MCALHEDLRTFLIISGWIIRRNISDKFCTENRNLFYVQ